MKFSFVTPRYFEGIAGGAETLIGGVAQQLSARGDEVEIWTTCAADNRTWQNEFPAGTSNIQGISVTRFPVDARDIERWVPIQLAIHRGEPVSVEEQLTWMRESVNSSELYNQIAARGSSFDAIFFGPYLFGCSFWGSLIHPQRSVLIPCLHDESYAYLEVVASMFRQVRGCLFNTEAELHLAHSLYGECAGGVVGMGFELPSAAACEQLTPYFEDNFPYILYLGRKETGKNVQVLLDYFCEAKDTGALPPTLRLVILGGGSFSDLHRPRAATRPDLLDLPHLSEGEKQRLLRHALYLCQPSRNESFSIVLMEAWMVGTPVVVHGACAVTRQHVVKSGGGLYFSSYSDLVGVTQHLLEHPDQRSIFAENGRQYVQQQYAWPAVVRRFDQVMAGFFGGGDELVAPVG